MKKLATLTAAAALLASSVHAGGMAEPIVMAPVEIADVAEESSSNNLLIPLILLALIFIALREPGGNDQVITAINSG